MTIRSPQSHHELANLLQGILDEAHQNHTYIPDQQQYGREEFWTPNTIGDCEDFALACRQLLKQRHGLDSNLIYCLTETKEPHLVLSKEGWILDNRHRFVTRRNALFGYTWIAAGLPDGHWYRIKPQGPKS